MDINNVTEVEDLYLISLKINQCLSYFFAEKKSMESGRTFEKCFADVCTDDVLNELIEFLNKERCQFYLKKIGDIEDKYKPAKESWSGLHGRYYGILQLLKNNKNFKLTNIVGRSVSLLKNEEIKFRKNDDLISAETTKNLIEGINSSIQKYLNNSDECAFEKAIENAINEASLITEEKGWRGLIDAIAKSIFGFFQIKTDSKFSFFKTPIKEDIKELRHELNVEFGMKSQHQ